MYVCICNGVTDSQIRQAAAAGCREVAELTMRTGCGATCGSCLDMAGDLLRRSHADHAVHSTGALYEFPLIASAA